MTSERPENFATLNDSFLQFDILVNMINVHNHKKVSFRKTKTEKKTTR